MRGRIRAAEVIHRIHDAAAEQMAPHAVDSRLGEIRGRGHPFGQFTPGQVRILEPNNSAVKQRRLHGFPRTGVHDAHLLRAGHIGGHFLAIGKIENHRLLVAA